MANSVIGQKPKRIIVTTIERTDRTFHKKDELFLENNVTKNQVIFDYDSVNQSYASDKYLVETYFNIWDGDTIVKEKLKTKHKKWSTRIDSSNSNALVNSLKRDIDTLLKDMSVLHTSHHYLTIYIEVISENDTVKYYKTKPFEYLTPWFSKELGSILNPNIDEQLFIMLPEKFIGREKLKLVPKKPKPH